MSRGLLSVAAGAIVLAALTFTGIRQARAQEQPPDLQMLLNLDLFSSPPDVADSENPGRGGGSMVDQIRALRQMGLLNQHPDAEGPQPLPPPGPPPSFIPPWIFAPTGGGE